MDSKNYLHIVAILCGSLLCSSCIKDEAPNNECDITRAWLPAGSNTSSIFFDVADSVQNVPSTEENIVFNVKRNADLTALAPQFAISDGATIVPQSGTVRNFSTDTVTYTVTSQDGQWHRTYKVSFKPTTVMIGDTLKYDFENYGLTKLAPDDDDDQAYFYFWHDEQPDGTWGTNWATGNSGFRMSMYNAKPDEYPSTVLDKGYSGHGVKLTTLSTGELGEMVHKPIAAGNLFLGNFNLQSALMNPLQATEFGIPFPLQPVKFTGYYTYEPGKQVTNQNGDVLSNTTDSATIYAVLYRNKDAKGNTVVLHGDDVKTNNNIVAIADIGYVKPVSTWTPFSIEFNYTGDIDLDVLESRGYNLTLVFSSSKEGASFTGAIGSTLCIDNVRVICKKEK